MAKRFTHHTPETALEWVEATAKILVKKYHFKNEPEFTQYLSSGIAALAIRAYRLKDKARKRGNP